MHIAYTGASGDVTSGVDAALISSVTDIGAGNYTFNLTGKASAERNCFLKGWSSSTADVALQVTAVTGASMTVQCTVGGIAADADISLTIGLTDSRLDYEA